ncbi:ATP-binding protein [Yinghuangia sp. ASG 101]|uniref:ATP-binding protein n=1 Tax=Yinghuangia sp. ASG 101 TaxID=2896848 RepID=UPI001E4E2B5C|nr:ATP-binding protein [Yinghuangia sp. ASG 101]UGQ13579.1 ATP-binding protein [Yinghuangia sp. ASG 101]
MDELDWYTVTFSPEPRSVGRVRAHVAGLCASLGIDGDGPITAISELAANAVEYAGGHGDFTVAARQRAGMLWIVVSDRLPCTIPLVDDVDPLADSGRGLLMARSVSAAFAFGLWERGKSIAVGFPLAGASS